MTRFFLLSAISVFLLFQAAPVPGQNEITELTFDSVPPGTSLVSQGGEIQLQGDTAVAGVVRAAGEVESATGFRFPDGTTQITAAPSVHQAASRGLYHNTIPEFTPPNAYTEICIKDTGFGPTSFDVHSGSEPTTGGNCLPGDVGWIIERQERGCQGGGSTRFTATRKWLEDGMRLPDPFEWNITCGGATDYQVENMTDQWEWASNGIH
ncbi:MAG: hypothetical protein MI919_20365, partial [Holophagales bacterium]|nr:hypothetical protein [Holophagales bacterium]